MSDTEATSPSTDSIGRDLDKARDAFQVQDAKLSILAHNAQQAAKETHGSGGTWLKSIIFGGMDGILQAFAVISAVSGGGLPLKAAIFMGFSTAIADALSMGIGDFLGTKAENDFIKQQRKREEWECENYLEGEKNEMIEIYKKKGITEEDARELVQIFSKNPKMFVDVMMVDELGLSPEADESPLKNGLVTFFSFWAFGFVPLISYILLKHFLPANLTSDPKVDVAFFITIGITLMTLFVLGFIKGKLTHMNKFKSGILVVIVGAFACGVSYGLSALVSLIAGKEHAVL